MPNPEAVAANAELAYAALSGRDESIEPDLEIPDGPTEILRTVRARRVQAFFRAAVLASYNYRCALSDIALPELLNASHIIPWKADTARRADPRNGIALNALYDRAFDRGLITFDESFRVVLSGRVRSGGPSPLHLQTLIDLEGQKLRIPDRFAPDPLAMAYHREHVFDCVVRA